MDSTGEQLLNEGTNCLDVLQHKQEDRFVSGGGGGGAPPAPLYKVGLEGGGDGFSLIQNRNFIFLYYLSFVLYLFYLFWIIAFERERRKINK